MVMCCLLVVLFIGCVFFNWLVALHNFNCVGIMPEWQLPYQHIRLRTMWSVFPVNRVYRGLCLLMGSVGGDGGLCLFVGEDGGLCLLIGCVGGDGGLCTLRNEIHLIRKLNS